MTLLLEETKMLFQRIIRQKEVHMVQGIAQRGHLRNQGKCLDIRLVLSSPLTAGR
jgi:hypothetical protein